MKLGQTEIQIPPIWMGTWQAGKAMWSGIDDRQSKQALVAAFEAGITAFDTAAAYGKGHSERIVSSALGPRRHQVIYATKVFANQLGHDQVIRACEKSLKNLATDYIDLYQIHWPAGSFGSKAVPIAETMGALTTLQQQGKIRAIGVSNFTRDQLAEAERYGRIDSLQPPYSLFWRHAEQALLPYCAARQITVLAYSPMAQGILTGKFDADHRFAKKDHRVKNRLFQPHHFTRVQTALAQLAPIAERHGASRGQLALAWVISHAGICAIAGARNADQASQNAAAARIVLTQSDLAQLDRISRTVTDHLDDNPVQWL